MSKTPDIRKRSIKFGANGEIVYTPLDGSPPPVHPPFGEAAAFAATENGNGAERREEELLDVDTAEELPPPVPYSRELDDLGPLEDEPGSPAELPDRPVIRLEVGELHKSVDRGTEALRADPDLYERGHALVHVTRASRKEQDSTGRAIIEGTPKIHTLALAALRVRLHRWARWERQDRRGDWNPAEPSTHVVEGIAAAREWPALRSLKGIIEAPSLRPDGTVLDQPGYDAATGFLYAPSGDFWPVAAQPTRDDAKRSYAALAALFDDFPYALPSGQSMAVAAVLTLLARPAIKGSTPAFIFDATTPGSGKTLQIDVCSGIATGREASRQHFPFVSGRDRDAELSKVLASIGRRGASLVNFDNLDAGSGSFGGSALELLITARDTFTFRILGKTEDLTVAWRTVVFGSGNNVDWTLDMGRRILVARLESWMDDPENRPLDTYRHPELAGRLFEHVIERRAFYVHHALTLLRAYFVAGRPLPSGFQPWGSFEAWSQVIAGALLWVGAPDPMLCRPSQQAEESPEKLQHQMLVREWAAFCRASGQPSITAHALLALLYPKDRSGPTDPKWDDLRGAIEHFAAPKPGGGPEATAVARMLRKYKGAPARVAEVGPLRKLVPDGQTCGRARWKVEDVPLRRVEGDVARL